MFNKIGFLAALGIVSLLLTIPSSVTGQGAETTAAFQNKTPVEAPFQGTEATEPEMEELPGSTQVENSIVKIFSTLRKPDFAQPWTKQSAMEVTGSGFVIEGNRILTNAHVVLYSTQVEVQGNKS
ncbi:MAG: serine protease, partial [Acidobacteriota bacterium]